MENLNNNVSEKFLKLYTLNVNERVEQKNGLNYLSWAYAWAEFKKIYPDATYEIKKDESGRCYFGAEDIGYMVYTSVTAGELTYEMWLPVMDGANKSMKLNAYTYKTKYGEKEVEAISMFDINKTVMRCLVKNLAMFGLGLYIYSGEDLPEQIQPEIICPVCNNPVKDVKKKDGTITPAQEVFDACGGMCYECYKKNSKEKNKNE